MSCKEVDNHFGPYAGHCRGGFDFTLSFEEIVLSILPLALLLLIVPLRVSYLSRRSIKVESSRIVILKLVLWAIFATLQITLVAVWALPATIKTKTSIANAAITFVGSFALAFLSFIEHQRTIRPCLILEAYLCLTIVFDGARVRTLWLQGYNNTVAAVTTATITTKIILLCIESLSKSPILRDEWKKRSLSPETTSGLLAKLNFWWLHRLFQTGYSRSLSIEDMLPLDKHLTSQYLYEKLHLAWRRQTQKYSLLIVFLWQLKWHLLSAFPPRLGLIAFTFCQPFLITRTIDFSQQSTAERNNNVGYGLIGAYFIVYCGIAFTTAQYQHLTYRAITMARGGLITMLFAKSSTLKANSIDSSSALTLMSADIERIYTGWQTMHEIWAAFIEIAIAIYLLARQLGVACVLPLAIAILSFFGSLFVMNMVVKRQALWLEAIEKRISATTNMLGSMKRIKMTGLAQTLFSNVHALRVQELSVSKRFRRLLIGSMFFAFTTPVIAPVLAFTVFALLALRNQNTTLDTSRAFTSLSLFALLAEPLSLLIMSMTSFAGSFGCFARIQAFLETEEHEDKCSRPLESDFNNSKSSQAISNSSGGFSWSEKSVTSMVKKAIGPLPMTDGNALVVEDGSFGWDAESPPLISSINLRVPQGKLTMLVGRVGSGKTTLLKAMLGEVPPMSGNVRHLFPGDVSYCEQSPFQMNGTIRESIIAFSEPDDRWYHTVLTACALDEDLRQVPQGDRTRIGSKGIAMSGGQSQRLALARAIYARHDLCILDDVFSGLDLDTENMVFHNLLGHEGLLRQQSATIVLASSSNKRLPFADQIIVLGDDGQIAEQGTFAELKAVGGFVSGLDLKPAEWGPRSSDSEPTFENQLVLSSLRSTKTTSPSQPQEDQIDTTQFDANKRTGDLAIYAYYIRSVGTLAAIIFIVAISGYVFCNSFPQIWLGWWSNYNEEHPNGRLGYWLGIYALLGVMGLISLIISCWQIIVTMVPQSGANFHSRLLHTVLNAPLTFFTTTDTGTTLNRFSQDLQLIDMDLPLSALNFFAALMLCLAQVILIGITSHYAAISFPFWFLALYFIQKFYLRTSRQLRFLDLEAKSPLYALFSETIAGLTTIRAFGWQRALATRHEKLLDLSQRPFYLLFAVQRWLQLVLDLLVAAVAVLLMILITCLQSGVFSGAYVGIALVNVILFSQNLKALLQYWTTLETHIGAVARVRNFIATTKSEDDADDDDDKNINTGAISPSGDKRRPVQIPPDWPSTGAITLENISVSYTTPHHPVLKNLTLTLPAGSKTAIVGRSGSGKSTLTLSLFRMLPLTSGTITIDGINLSSIPRDIVRERIVGLPQDVFLLDGNVRLNIDPYGKVTDEVIVDALEEVQLWEGIRAKGGLEADVGGLKLSHGQRQLFCLAQALVRREACRVLVLDEATSSVDDATDILIQRLIRKHFAKHTIIAVAHKLHTIADFDRVAVLDKGRLVEFDDPNVLRERERGVFRGLWEGQC